MDRGTGKAGRKIQANPQYSLIDCRRAGAGERTEPGGASLIKDLLSLIKPTAGRALKGRYKPPSRSWIIIVRNMRTRLGMEWTWG